MYNDALNYCRALCRKGKFDEAEDIFQDSLLKALENFDNLDDEGKFKNWFFTIITNTYISYYRKKVLRKFISIDEYKDIDRLHGIFPHSQYDILYDELHIALSKINKKEKIAFLLFEIGGFSIEEIRIIQKEKSASAIKSRLSRTRAKLKEIIDSLEKNRIIGNSIPTNNIELDTIEIINNIKP